jgi:hypothetical protein
MIIRVEWSRDALRDLTIWIAGFIRDEIELRAARRFILDDVRHVLIRSDGRPPGSYELPSPAGAVVVWEYIGRTLWLVFHRIPRPPTLWRRLTGRTNREAVIVTVMRRPPTPPELEALHR